MSRNAAGTYSLPLPPVQPGETIEAAWANTSLDDLGQAITQSLDRSGRGAMLAPLILSSDPITNNLQATSKAYVDQFLVYATGLAVGSVCNFAGQVIPAGFFECNGQALSRTAYPDLFSAIGTTYGSGDGSTTFNVPDLRDQFIRGKSDARNQGSKQSGSLASHTHAVSDPGHNHSASQSAHSHTISTGAHSHSVSDPGHSHSAPIATGGAVEAGFGIGTNISALATSSSVTGVSVQAVGDLGGSTSVAQPAVSVGGNYTGLSIGAAGGTETVPQNMAMIYIIKAENDASSTIVPVTGITSSDTNMISVDESNPIIPELVIHSNIAFGTVKLNGSGKVPLNLLPTASEQLLGYWNASTGQNPSEASPSTVFNNGDYFIISVAGTINVYNPATNVSAATAVSVGWEILYLEASVAHPEGWYYQVPTDLAEAVAKTSSTGSAVMPNGTTAERDVVPLYGYTRANSDTNQMEWWNGTAWAPMGGGATGGLNNPFIYENDIHVTADYTITTGKNAMSAGPITVDSGVSVTVPPGSVWSIV